MKLIKKLLGDRRVRFLITGGINTGFSFGVYAFVTLFGGNYPLATAISLVSTVTLSYFLNKYFTFQQKKRSGRELLVFCLVYLVSYAINNLMLYALRDLWGVNEYIAQLICVPVITVISFVGHSKFSFANKTNTTANTKHQ